MFQENTEAYTSAKECTQSFIEWGPGGERGAAQWSFWKTFTSAKTGIFQYAQKCSWAAEGSDQQEAQEREQAELGTSCMKSLQ